MRAVTGALGMELELQGAALSRKTTNSRDGFKALVDEQMEQDRTLAQLEKEQDLGNLRGEIKDKVGRKLHGSQLVSIHRRLLPDGSYIISEMRGTALVSHYTKRLDCNKVSPSKPNVDMES